MHVEKKLYPLIWFTFLYIIAFAAYALIHNNAEFIFYTSIVLFFFFLLLMKYKKLGLSHSILWALSIWGLLHMAGGNVPVNGSVLYNLKLIPVVLKYDQFVHFFGFATTTVVGWQLLRPYLISPYNKTTILVLVVMIGIGAGALNEVLEFLAVLFIPDTNVGGYVNTGFDMIFNLIGALFAALVIIRKEMEHI